MFPQKVVLSHRGSSNKHAISISREHGQYFRIIVLAVHPSTMRTSSVFASSVSGAAGVDADNIFPSTWMLATPRTTPSGSWRGCARKGGLWREKINPDERTACGR